jgi:hypothetical protein
MALGACPRMRLPRHSRQGARRDEAARDRGACIRKGNGKKIAVEAGCNDQIQPPSMM